MTQLLHDLFADPFSTAAEEEIRYVHSLAVVIIIRNVMQYVMQH